MLQRLRVVVSQVKAGITFENLLNEIRQAIYSLYQATEITKKLNTNIMNSIKFNSINKPNRYYIYEFRK